MDGWMGGWMDGCMDGWMDGWMDGCDCSTFISFITVFPEIWSRLSFKNNTYMIFASAFN